MRKFTMLIAFLLFVGMRAALAQFEVKGTVTDAKDGTPLPGVSIIVKGTLTGTVTDAKGNYSLAIPEGHNDMIFSFIGMLTKEVKIDGRAKIDVAMQEDVVGLNEVVVTALGISREKKSLGYSTQQVSGSDLNQTKTDNFVNLLSGRAAGVQVKASDNMGGSTNILIRGVNTIRDDNQALFVVDGVPIDNSRVNNAGQISGRNGYDYGNAASDIDPNDIQSMTILKGAAATNKYGSRGANGVILITTKKGSRKSGMGNSVGVGISSNITTGFIDKSTFPKYQTNYGGGYGPYYSNTDYPGFYHKYDINNDGQIDYSVPTKEDASLGEKFDPNFMVYQWDSFDPASPNYLKATPWVDSPNGPLYFFQTPIMLTNSVDVSGGGDKTLFRLSYTNMDQKGIMPNSKIIKNNFLLNGSYNVLKNLKVSAQGNFITTDGKGRNSTGYSDNILSSFRQWMETNVDYKAQKDIFDATGRNVTWNAVSPYDAAPAYWDNPFWARANNFETDRRNRMIGYTQADWSITNYLSLMGRVSVDHYTDLQEERKAVGSSSGEFGVGRPDVTSGYSRLSRTFTEINYDLMLNFNKNFGEDFSLSAFAGTNFMRRRIDQVFESTDGGLIVPGYYDLSNSVNQMLAPDELFQQTAVDGYFIGASFGFKNLLYLDASIRQDVSSTLPKDKWSYNYPSISGSFVFSNLLNNADWLQLGKVRLSYAKAGNYAPWGSIFDAYAFNGVFNGDPLYSLPSIKNNQDLKPEMTHEWETGLEMTLLKKRLSFDLSLYKRNTVDQIIPISVSYATGYTSKYVNAGEIENKGIELQIIGTPIVKSDFRWDVTLNWARNINKVVSLKDSIQNLQIANLQGGVTINARVNEPFGTIQGTDYVYHDGKKVIGEDGYYLKTPTSDIVIGNINPDWNAGLRNTFTYKNWALNFLIDWQHGGSVFSLDQNYGLGTGIYDITDGTNDLGNPVRDPVLQNDDGTYKPESGGFIFDGVVEQADGSYTQNTTRIDAVNTDYGIYSTGYYLNPNSAFVYDASYVKLREVVLTYSLPSKVLASTPFRGISFSLVGSNLWIIYKNLPYADPEASQGAGRVQGWQSGVMPSTRNVGFSVNLQF